MSKKRVAIFGAGVSGLTSIKACLEEDLIPCCFEQRADTGGIWNYQEEQDGIVTVHKHLVTNTSKYMSNFSDFPFEEKDTPFLPHKRMNEYLRQYAEHFKLMEYIQFKTKVLDYSKSPTYKDDGSWNVSICGPDGDVQNLVFDYVLVCAGLNVRPSIPKLHGRESTTIPSSNSSAFKHAKPYTGKRVLVIGNGHTAGDIACELSDVAAKVYLSVGDGCWIRQHLDKKGIPHDMVSRRWLKWVPLQIIKKVLRSSSQERLDHFNYGLNPEHDPFDCAYMLNSEISFKISHGAVEPIARVAEMKESKIILVDGRVVDDVDHVVYATGYICHELFEKAIAFQDGEKGNFPRIHKMVFPIDHDHHTIALIGMIGGAPNLPVYELQARYAALVLSGKIRLPDRDEMIKELPNLKAMMIKNAPERLLYTGIQLIYCDMLADAIGAYPYFWKLLFTRPKLAFHSIFGNSWPYHYRLLGPGVWNGAEEACLEANNRMYGGIKR